MHLEGVSIMISPVEVESVRLDNELSPGTRRILHGLSAEYKGQILAAPDGTSYTEMTHLVDCLPLPYSLPTYSELRLALKRVEQREKDHEETMEAMRALGATATARQNHTITRRHLQLVSQ